MTDNVMLIGPGIVERAPLLVSPRSGANMATLDPRHLEPGAFKRQFVAFVRITGGRRKNYYEPKRPRREKKRIASYATRRAADADDLRIGYSTFFAILAETTKLSFATFERLTQRMQIALDRARTLRRGGKHASKQWETEFATQGVTFVLFVGDRMRDGDVVIDRARLRSLYPADLLDPDLAAAVFEPRIEPTHTPTSTAEAAATGDVNISVGFNVRPDTLAGYSGARLREIFVALLGEDGVAALVAILEGCTEIIVSVSREQAERLRHLFATGQLEQFGVVDVWETSASRLPQPTVVSLVGHDVDAQLDAARRKLLRRERLIRPWRRLRWFLDPVVRRSPIASIVRESEAFAYSRETVPDAVSAKRIDLAIAWGLWPLVTALLIAMSLGVARAAGVRVDVLGGLLSGVVLSIAGGQVCATVLSPLAVSAAGIPLGWAFGFAHGVILGQLGHGARLTRSVVFSDPFVTVNGGLIGLAAPVLRGDLATWLVVFIITMIAIAIAAAAWLMAQPARATPFERVPPLLEARAIAAGVLMGGAIPLVLGGARLLESLGVAPAPAFIASFATLGAIAMTQMIRPTDAGRTRAVVFGLGHAVLTSLLCAMAFAYASTPIGYLALAATTAWFHSTWFTAAFVVGGALGSPRAATIAAAIEGAVGFTAFVLVRMNVQPPPVP